MGKIVINGQNYGKVVIGQEGGGVTPESGIVPTAWSSNGFVTAVDCYGDIIPGALSSGTNNPNDSYPSAYYNSDAPENIDTHDSELEDFSGQQIFNYLKSATFVTAPTTIGQEAFKNQVLMEVDNLPEGIETIGNDAFNNCCNLTLTTIPESVESIGDHAFYHTNEKSYITPNYDENATYSIGDVVFYDEHVRTCLVDIDEPESFNSNHWIYGYYPELIGVYDTSATHSNGDIVYEEDYDNVSTFCIVPQTYSDSWADSYCPEVIGLFNPNQLYNPGDVVGYIEDGKDQATVYTCVKATTSVTDINDYEYWLEGSYPHVMGTYDDTVSYSIGDVVFYGESSDGRIWTCVVPTSGGPFDEEYWIDEEAPLVLGMYDETATYSIGDVVGMQFSESYSAATYVDSRYGADGFITGYYPEVTIYDNLATYTIGNTVYYPDDEQIYTCIRNTEAGDAPAQYDNTYWVLGYYPEVSSIYNSSNTYNLGDVVYNTSQNEIMTLVQPSETVMVPSLFHDYYVPDVIEYYNESHSYYPGDIVTYQEAGDSQTYFYICLSPTVVTGSFNSSKWYSIFDSGGNRFVTSKVYFLGTPNYIGSDAFTSSGHNVFFVPWDANHGPELETDSNQFVIYNYNPEIGE